MKPILTLLKLVLGSRIRGGKKCIRDDKKFFWFPITFLTLGKYLHIFFVQTKPKRTIKEPSKQILHSAHIYLHMQIWTYHRQPIKGCKFIKVNGSIWRFPFISSHHLKMFFVGGFVVMSSARCKIFSAPFCTSALAGDPVPLESFLKHDV